MRTYIYTLVIQRSDGGLWIRLMGGYQRQFLQLEVHLEYLYGPRRVRYEQ